MNRRRLLRAAGAATAVGLAGCVGGQPDGRDGTPTDGPVDPPSSFSVGARGCGNQANRAEVTFGDGVVTVDGTTWGSDACYTGRLASATLEDGTLTVRVVTERVDGKPCAQCISEIEYRATVAVSAPPDEVVVVHDGETVTTARPP